MAITVDRRQRRIIRLAQEWNVTLPSAAPARLERPASLPSHRTPTDDHTAEDLLQRHAIELSHTRPKSGLQRAFSTSNLKKGKHWEPKHILQVLTTWISQAGSAGVAEALIAKLTASGVDLGAMSMQKSNLLSRRRSIDGAMDKAKLMRLAVQNNQLEMVQVLVPYADPMSLDACLPLAVRQGNTPIVELLLQFGANVSQTAEGQDAFRQACNVSMLADMVKLILQSDGRPSPSLASQSMVDATRIGSLEMVTHLSRSVADGDYNQAEALQLAVSMGRGDLSLAIIMGNRPPQAPGVSQAFENTLNSSALTPGMKLQLAELLICAGADGRVLSHALQVACDSQFYEMARLLASYGVSIEYNNAAALRNAIQKGQLDLVCSLLTDSATLSPSAASSCVSSIPQQIAPADRYMLLDLLLRKGAKGRPLDDMLIVAAEAGDTNSVELLLKPFFPEPPSNGANGMNGGRSTSQMLQRHEVASPDYREGHALRTAVLRLDTTMTARILASQPSPDTLTRVFPLTKNLTAADRYEMVELFLKGALSGPPLHAALQDAISEDISSRDGALIGLLLQHGADINYNRGQGLQSVILQADLPLLETLIHKASPQTAAARIADVMRVSDHRTRYGMMVLLLGAGASIDIEGTTAGLAETLKEKPVDMSLLRLMLQQGNADVNNSRYNVISAAVGNPDPKVLELVLGLGKPQAETISKGLLEVSSLPPSDGKTWKMQIALAKSRRPEDLSTLLTNEVHTLTQSSSRAVSLSTIKMLLDNGADVNHGPALCHAVSSGSTAITDALLESPKPPTQATLDPALPHALKLSDLMDRLSFTKKLIAAGASPLQINRGLIHAVEHYTDDVSLLGVLAEKANTTDGEALAMAASKEASDVIDLLLKKSKHTLDVKHAALARAMSIRDRASRRGICARLLEDGISKEEASNALLIAARDGDIELGNILMAHGASISSNGGQAIIEACRGGSAEVVEILLKSEGQVHKATLENAFQAATEVRDLNKRAVIFEKLLRRGVSGEPVDAQLAFAARYGEAGHEVLRVLLAAGADPNYQSGEAVLVATRTAFMRNLELLLGLWDQEGRQKRPSQPTLLRAFEACWGLNRDTRYNIILDLFKAGVPVVDIVHAALNDAVNEEDSEDRLIQLLLDHGASPTANECKALINAVKKGASSSISVLLSRPLPAEALNYTFAESYTPDSFTSWFSQSGIQTIRVLLEHGAQGGALSQMALQVMNNHTPDTADLADEFITLLASHGLDVNYNRGEPLQVAASQANVGWTKELLALHPSTESLSFAFQHIFDTALDQDDALQLFELFADYRDGETRVDVMAQKPDAAPVLVQAMTQYPRSLVILKTLLDTGFYHDQATFYRIYDDIDEQEQMTLLTWAIAQPQKKISSSLIELLLDRGAKVNVETPLSRTTPLMQAIQNRRPDLVRKLLLRDAEVDIVDYKGRSPLSMATDIGGKLGTEMMADLLAADPSRDDGSLHNAARSLSLDVVSVLIQSGHDPDFPSPCHEGRSALGEICLKGSDTELTAEREKKMQKVMNLLIDQGSDLSIKTRGKSLLYLCFEARDPVATSRILLKAGMWKFINKPLNQYTDEDHTYSPTMYVKKLLPESDYKEELLALLYANRAVDVYYANSGAQPEDAVGLPEDVKVEERVRKARLSRLAEENQDFALSLARKRELASVEGQIWKQKAEMEDARRRQLQNEDLLAVRNRAQLEESLEAATHRRRVSEQRSLTEASISRTRAIAATELDAEEAKQRKTLEWQQRLNSERVDHVRAISAVTISEREELDRLENKADQRLKGRLNQQKKLLDVQERLNRGGSLGSASQRRQIEEAVD
ncbi:uncharacterized protein F5Z01DRAFT_660131 [Emericellopsis atlantica]|uniref:Uncharacterized protein n=1 Tax=Emericellopsis atlantica TaxID=2614577 RepID=A0A9P7ZJ91_9HYPO|nr:uncharacterized protein F5Z01DRAFT_660131 [Emericellopsis atlantica]KAG9252635.1 hypothetical protein F5Z01DRAFT_660131 [Emericellopsis atlantica]